MLQKLLLVPVLVIIACVFAGIFGIIHNQISYTVSPEYFHAFKFVQFNISLPLQTRVGASLVGLLASWWMGVCLGFPLGLISLIHPSWREQVKITLKSYVWIGLTGTAFSILGLMWGVWSLSAETLPAYPYPIGVADKVAFTRAGYMHNASYLGGLLGLIIGCIYQVYGKLQGDKSAARGASSKAKVEAAHELGLDLSVIRSTPQSRTKSD